MNKIVLNHAPSPSDKVYFERIIETGVEFEWEEDKKELRLFESVDFWVGEITKQGFIDSGQRLLQANDPSRNTLLCFLKPDV